MFYGFVITNAGNNLLNNMVAGEKLTITKVVMEKGTAESAEAARQLTAPIDPGPDGTSTKPTVEGNAVSLIVEYRSDLNGGLNEGFWIGGFAVYGKTDTSAEIMMYYGSLGDKKQYVSAYVSGTAPDVRRYPVSITVKDGIKVDVSYPAEAWMTAEDVADYFNGTLKPDLEGSLKEILEQHDEDQTAHENRFQGKQDNLNTLQAKDNLVDADMVAITDSANNETAKRISWANIKALLNRIFVPLTRTVNNKGLTSDVTLTGADINVSGTDATSISTALSNKADVGAPQSYTLPLSTGWSAPGGARYQRTQDNMVVVTTGGIQLDSGASVSDGTQIATLPTGYRPRDYILIPAVIQDGGARYAAAVQITVSGTIVYNGPSNTTYPFRIFINSSYFVD